MSALTPMIQNVKFVGQWKARLFQVLERPHDVAVFHVSLPIIIGADNHDAGMAAACGLDEFVKIEEIIVVSCQQEQTLLDRVKHMARIRCSGKGHIRRLNHRMTRFAEPSDQRFFGRVIIEIELHASGE